jgi:hypothetical protein
MLKGMFLGAALMFLLIVGWLLFLFPPRGQQFAVGGEVLGLVTIWMPHFWGIGVGVIVLGVLGVKFLRGNGISRLLNGMFAGAGLMFAAVTACLVVLLRPVQTLNASLEPTTEQAVAIHRMTISAATVWSPIFWGVVLGVVVLGLLGMKFLAQAPRDAPKAS